MAIQVLEAEDADMYRLFEIASLAFAHREPFWNASWPHHQTEPGRRQGARRFTRAKHADPNVRFVKAVDEGTGGIVGMAEWIIYSGGVLPGEEDQTDYWDSEEERVFAAEMAEGFIKDRNEAIARTGGNLVCLAILTVDPASQRRGVGSALVEWGVSRADALGVEAVVEASPFGKGLYAKFGYRFVKDVVVENSERFRGRERQRHAWMVRERREG